MRKPLEERIQEAIAYIEQLNFSDYEKGKHVVNEDFYFLIQEYVAKDPKVARFEAHKNYVDIQYIIEGKEAMEVAPLEKMEVMNPYNPEKDVEHYHHKDGAAKFVVTKGGYAVFYPADAHKPGVRVGDNKKVKKIVGKVRV